MTYLATTLIIDEDTPSPVVGTSGDIPAVHFRAYPVDLTIQFNDNAHAPGYLREWARRLLTLADQLDPLDDPEAADVTDVPGEFVGGAR